MNIQDVLSKVAKGEELTDAEKEALAGFNLQKALDDNAANARRKAEERQTAAETERDDLRTRIATLEQQIEDAGNAGKSDLEKAQADVEKLTARLAEREATIETMTAETAAAARSRTISGLLDKSGIKFIDGVDQSILKGAFEATFKGLDADDLGNDQVTGPLVEAWRTTNKGVIQDTTGGGSGGPPHDGNAQRPTGGAKTPDKQTAEERAKDLREQRGQR